MDIGAFTGDWDHDELPANVQVGQGTRIERRTSFDRFHSERDPGFVMGANCLLYTWAGIGVERDGVIEIGDDCVLVGPIFLCAERITIGNRVVVSYNVTIADCDFHPMDPDERRRDALAVTPDGDVSMRPRLKSAPIEIGDDVHLGIGAVVLKGVTIGAGAHIGPGTVVTKDVPAGAVVVGNPGQSIDRAEP